ncbi:hypothetical protein BJ508DRAFT_347927 [Ascobolus immersus RN42]|uniref:Uncharacterized protein n=1 Tax=Ascobolus immersus RN42 TaxID=1160509 RepID=A0A3N4I2X5_ASCIM|nr:hypothetical protein BJ508DRAFT_347927 [Ascobolus immersus RN42]
MSPSTDQKTDRLPSDHTVSPPAKNNSVNSTSSTAPVPTKYVYQQILELEAKLTPEERQNRRAEHRALILGEYFRLQPTSEEREQEKAMIEAMSLDERVEYVVGKGYERASAEAIGKASSPVMLRALCHRDDRPGTRIARRAVRHIVEDDDGDY